MCAIAGMVGLCYDDTVISKMLCTMKRRGPDENGVVLKNNCALLHSRLVIIDPEGGKQPMKLMYGDETYTIVYNGELYNTEEIREQLLKLGHQFQHYSDTEVVLHAYAQWKEKCLVKFNGIFGFAVWEHKARRLFMARDRMGVKPFFFARKGNGIVFASEIKTILASGHIPPVVKPEGVAQLLLMGPGRIPGNGVFADIEELKPGYYGFFSQTGLETKRYWSLQDRIHTASFDETADRVRYLVTDSIEKQMVSDVPFGTFLSGGLDSSLISAVCAAKYSGQLKTFSVDYLNNEQYFVPGKFQPNSDNSYIEIMQHFLSSDHHWTVLTPEQLNQALEAATMARDLPGMADVDFSLLAFCKEIRKEVKMALSGECADEIFGGYPWYSDPEIRQKEGFPWAQNTSLRATFIAKDFRPYIDPDEFVNEQYLATIRQCDILPENSVQEKRMKEMVNLNVYHFMQTLLDRKDRMSMFSGLEVRVPFCDYRIAEYLYGVPWEYKFHNGREKGLLRYAMRGVIPESILYRKKSPYPKTWDPAYKEIMKNRLRQLLNTPNAPVFQIVDNQAVAALLDGNFEWPWYGQLMKEPQTMAYILQVNYWLEEYGVELTV